MVEVEHAAEALAAQNTPGRRRLVLRRLDQAVVETLVISFSVTMGGVFADELAQMPFAEWYDPGQTLPAN